MWEENRIHKKKLQQENLKGIDRPRGRYMRRWEDNVKTDTMKQDIGGVDWIHLTQDGGQ